MQIEFERRKRISRQYSGKSIFSSRIICGDCGAFFGSKVWNSTSKYRRVIWQCNGKFKGDHKCETPHLDEETIKARFVTALNAIMPAGIHVTRVAPVEMKADSIAFACYRISYPAAAAAVLEQYNALETAPVEKHSKRGKKIVNLKEHIPQLSYTVLGDTVQLELCLPAAQELNLNPSLLTGFLEEKFGLPAASANILRTKFLTADRQLFV